jgi:hypothetical protein
MIVKKIDRATAKLISAQAVEILSKHFESFGLKVVGKSGSFSPDLFSKKFEFAVLENEKGITPLTPEEKMYKLEASFDAKMRPLGGTFMFRGSEYKIVGWASRSRRFPVLGQHVATGKRFKFEKEVVLIK